MSDPTTEKKRGGWWREVLFVVRLPAVLIAIIIMAPNIAMLYAYLDTRWCFDCDRWDRFGDKLRCVYAIARGDAQPYLRSPPTDEEMIDHFRKHRADFERLAKIYREDPSPAYDAWGVPKPTPEANAIMRRINVCDMKSDLQLWLPPNPYFSGARERIAELGLMRKLLHGEVGGRKYSGVVLPFCHKLVYRTWIHWFNIEYPRVWKSYYFTPIAPDVIDGQVQLPGLQGPPGGVWPIFPTLNSYPSDLGHTSCYRQFQPQWFIRLDQTGSDL